MISEYQTILCIAIESRRIRWRHLLIRSRLILFRLYPTTCTCHQRIKTQIILFIWTTTQSACIQQIQIITCIPMWMRLCFNNPPATTRLLTQGFIICLIKVWISMPIISSQEVYNQFAFIKDIIKIKRLMLFPQEEGCYKKWQYAFKWLQIIKL